jgi:hypothetical protein
VALDQFDANCKNFVAALNGANSELIAHGPATLLQGGWLPWAFRFWRGKTELGGGLLSQWSWCLVCGTKRF